MMIRPAMASETDLLSEMAMLATAHWGYEDAYMKAYSEKLSVKTEELDRFPVFVAVDEDCIRGFGQIAPESMTADLMKLFVSPEHMRRGVGRQLFDHAVLLASIRGANRMTIKTDPHACSFYERMGAVRIGDFPSSALPGLTLPLLEIRFRSMPGCEFF